MALPYRYYMTFILAIYETLFYAGTFFGWTSLVYVLKDEGYYYSDSCAFNETSQTSTVCEEQDANLNLVYTIAASSAFLSMLPSGCILDWYGTRITRILSHFLCVTGLLLTLISTPATSYLLFPAMTCMVVGGAALFLTLLQVGNLFAKHRSTVATIVSGCCDASIIVMLLVQFAHDAGISLQTSFTILICGSAMILITTFYFLPNDKIPWPLPPNYNSNTHYANSEENETKGDELPERKYAGTNQEIIEDENTNRYAENCRNEDFPTIKSCLLSPSFMLLMLWFSMLELRLASYTGTFNPFFVELTDGNQELVDHYTKVLGFIQFGGMLSAPFGGVILDRNKGKPNRQPYDDLEDTALGFAVTIGLCMLFSIITSIPMHRVQYAAFVPFAICKTFLFGILFASIVVMFPARFYGTLSGVVGVLGTIVNLLQYPLYLMTQEYFNNDFFMMNLILLIACASTFVLPVYVVYHARRMNKDKQDKIICLAN